MHHIWVTLGWLSRNSAPPLAYLFTQNNFKHMWALWTMYVLPSCIKMKLAGKCITLIVCLVLVHDAVCTHFRGGTFTYKPVNPSDPANTTVSSFAECKQTTFCSETFAFNDTHITWKWAKQLKISLEIATVHFAALYCKVVLVPSACAEQIPRAQSWSIIVKITEKRFAFSESK